MSHMICHCVDYVSLCMFRCQLPNSEKEIQLPSLAGNRLQFFHRRSDIAEIEAMQKKVVIHPGRHWQSKTFPKAWWDDVLGWLKGAGVKPIIIGADTDDNRGTVDVDAEGCVDLRGKTSISETIHLLKHSCNVLLTNDSSPLHMAAAGPAWIGYVATCKHPDYISHWRKGEFGWRMKNHGKGGIWEILSFCPNVADEVSAENVGDHLEKWLPDPKEFAAWAIEKATDFNQHKE